MVPAGPAALEVAQPEGALSYSDGARLSPEIRTMMSLARRSLNPTAKATAAAAESLTPVVFGPTRIATRLATIARCTVSANSSATTGRAAPDTSSVRLLVSPWPRGLTIAG